MCDKNISNLLTGISILAAIAGGYHGYKRNCDSVGWGIGWGIASAMFWPVALPIAFIQGAAKPGRSCSR